MQMNVQFIFIFLIFYYPLFDFIVEFKRCDHQSICIKYYLCPGKKLNTKGAGIIDRKRRAASYHICDDKLDVCCPNMSLVFKNIQPEINYQTTDSEPSFTTIQTEIQENHQAISTPWTLNLISILKEDEWEYLGECTLIHRRAAIGHINLANSKGRIMVEANNEVRRKVEYIKKHSQFDQITQQYAVALFIWEDSFDLINGKVELIKLPKNAINLANIDYCQAVERELNGAVHKKRMEIIQRENCESMIKDNDDFRLAESLLCVTNRCPKCKNKPGPELVCKIKDHKNIYILMGIFAFDYTTPAPHFFLNVAIVSDWIHRELNIFGITISFYKNRNKNHRSCSPWIHKFSGPSFDTYFFIFIVHIFFFLFYYES